MNVSISVPRLNVNYENPTIHDPLKRGVIRPDSELVQFYTYDKYIVQDEGVALPISGSGLTRLKETEVLTPSITLDNDYYYYFTVRMLTIPVYNTVDKWQIHVIDMTCYSFVSSNHKVFN